MVSRKDSARKVLTLKNSLAAAGCDGGKPDLPVSFQQGQAHGNTAIANGTVAFVYPHGTAAGAEVEITGTFQRGRNTLFYNSVQLGQDGGKIPGQGAFQNGHGSNSSLQQVRGHQSFFFSASNFCFLATYFSSFFATSGQFGLLGALNAQGTVRHIVADGGTGSSKGAAAHLDRRHQVGVAADECIIADGGAVLALAVIVAGYGAAAKVAVLAHIGIANVSQVADSVALGKVGVLGLHISARCTPSSVTVPVRTWVKGPILLLGAQMAVITLAGVHGGTGLNNGVLQ